MSTRINKKEIVRRVALQSTASEEEIAEHFDLILDTIYEAFKAGEGVTLKGFGSFYVRIGSSTWTFKFNPSQKLKALFGWSSTYRGAL